MTKEEHIKYWVESAEQDKMASLNLFQNDYFVHSAYLFHLVLEKLLKALWIKHNTSNIPPKTHNLIYLLNETSIKLDLENTKKLAKFNDFQLEARYPDYKQDIYKRLTKENAKLVKIDFEELEKCLHNHLL